MLPSSISFSFLHIDLTEIKQIFIQTLQSFINDLKNSLSMHFSTLIKNNEKTVNDLLISLEKIPSTIPLYVETRNFLDNEFPTIYKELQHSIEKSSFLLKILENFTIQCETIAFEGYFQSSFWMKKVEISKNTAENRLSEGKPKFKGQIFMENQRIFEEFKKFKEEINNMDHVIETDKIFHYAGMSKAIFSGLGELLEMAEKNNNNEGFLGYNITDFSGNSLFFHISMGILIRYTYNYE